MAIGAIDPQCVSSTNELPKLTPEQAAAHTWIPSAEVWEAIKKHSVANAAVVTIGGFAKRDAKHAVSRGQITIHTSKDPAGAPIFYRDVPLMPSETEKGIIKPLASNAIHLINWRLRDISKPESRVVLKDMVTCANCHSFSRDGKTMGMDMDGPANDKGLYALVPVQKQITINTTDMVNWNPCSVPTTNRPSPTVWRLSGNFAMRKSIIFNPVGRPSGPTRNKLSGLMSRWTAPDRWTASRPDAACRAENKASFASKLT